MNDLQFHPLANLFPLMDGQDFDDLVADIATHGLREAVVVHEGLILDGRNRYRACDAAGVPVRLVPYEGDDALGFVVSLNLRRRHLDEGQRGLVAAKIANMTHGGNRTDQGANLPLATEAPPPVSIARAAEMLNVSERTVKNARAVLSRGVPELTAKVESGAISVSAAEAVARTTPEEQHLIVAQGERAILAAAKHIRAGRANEAREVRIERIAQIAKGNAPLDIAAKYPVIYADPPWRYENPPMGASNRSIENHYPTMSLDEICALPVRDIVTEDAILYMWATAPKLAECMQVIAAWGFDYRTNFVWVKDKIGMGYHARSQHEILLVAKRGSIPPPAVADRVSSVVMAERGEHSAKPAVFYELIESFYPTLPKIELFCRSPREGWAVWGNQSDGAA